MNIPGIVNHNVDATREYIPRRRHLGIYLGGRRGDVHIENRGACIFEMSKPGFGVAAGRDDVIAAGCAELTDGTARQTR